MPKGTQYYLGMVKSKSSGDAGKYSNLSVKENGEIVYTKKSYYGEFGLKDNVDKEMRRFKYFWRYNLGYFEFKDFELVVEDNQEVMVVFK